MSENEAKFFAIDNNLRFFLTSNLNGNGIQSFIDDLVNMITKKYNINIDSQI